MGVEVRERIAGLRTLPYDRHRLATRRSGNALGVRMRTCPPRLLATLALIPALFANSTPWGRGAQPTPPRHPCMVACMRVPRLELMVSALERLVLRQQR